MTSYLIKKFVHRHRDEILISQRLLNNSFSTFSAMPSAIRGWSVVIWICPFSSLIWTSNFNFSWKWLLYWNIDKYKRYQSLNNFKKSIECSKWFLFLVTLVPLTVDLKFLRGSQSFRDLDNLSSPFGFFNDRWHERFRRSICLNMLLRNLPFDHPCSNNIPVYRIRSSDLPEDNRVNSLNSYFNRELLEM